MTSLFLYITGLILFLVCLVSPAYSPYGAWDYSGLDAIKAALQLRPRVLLDLSRFEDAIALIGIAVSSVNSVFLAVSPLLFPVRRRFNHKPWFWIGVAAGITSIVAIALYMHATGFIKVRYGYYLWLAAVILVYLSFHPALNRTTTH